jgi:hypothetical protein
MKVVNEELDLARREFNKPAESLSDLSDKTQVKAALYQSKYVLLKS